MRWNHIESATNGQRLRDQRDELVAGGIWMFGVVISAQAGIQYDSSDLKPGFNRSDELGGPY
jgi:hypothetical protein